ncbi:MAG: FixH family protein [Alphaproteobacteria bacterium]
MSEDIRRDPKDKWILFYFIAFFATFFSVDALFVYLALNTHTGVIEERSYEKGLAYNEVLKRAETQPNLQEKVSYADGVLRWKIADVEGTPITKASVTAEIIRQVQDGHDFNVTLDHQKNGIYETRLSLPLQGKWLARLNSTWNNTQYQTTHQFIVK